MKKPGAKSNNGAGYRGQERLPGNETYEATEAGMPGYDFVCRKCKKRFSKTMSMVERGAWKPRCPKCRSVRVDQRIAAFFAQTDKKS